MIVEPARRRLLAAAVLLGVGLGGFFDGILFHQILQLHHMLTTRRPAETLTAVEVNMFWDGMFHAFTWLVTVGGLAALWRALADPAAPRPPRTFVGGLLLGWGLFNLVEGVVDHHVLGLHRVVEGAAHPWWDLGFLASGVALMGVGTWLVRADAPRPAPAPTARTPAVAIRR